MKKSNIPQQPAAVPLPLGKGVLSFIAIPFVGYAAKIIFLFV